MPETLLSPSQILLYGKVVSDLTITNTPGDTDANILARRREHNPFLQPGGPGTTVLRNSSNRSLDEQVENPDASLARIYGFSYEGHYYNLPRPMLFLVHGPGQEADRPNTRPARAPDDPERSGVGSASFSYSDNVRVWSYDKGDFSIRMDVETGQLQDILLEFAIESEGAPSSYSGARVSGARVSGARVSGARVSGARVSGGND